MRFLFLVLLFSVLIAHSVNAQTWADDEAPAAEGKTAAPRSGIVTDEEAGVVRIMIDGQPVLTINSSGLHVEGTVSAQSFDPAALTELPPPAFREPASPHGNKGENP